MINLESLNIKLTAEEQDVLRGRRGPVLQKILETVVLYGEALGAERLVDISGQGHFVITYALPGIAPSMEMLSELIEAGLKTRTSFTLDPKSPLDFENWFLTEKQVATMKEMYRHQAAYDENLLQLGLRDRDACTCTPYLPQVGNIPRRGDILAWSESACVIFANSVLGARTNKTGAILDLLINIAGKTPLAGLLTDEGRRAAWRVDLQTERLPLPQLLGAAIGKKVLADVPYIVGLDRFLGPGLNARTRDYLHEMGAACATAGAVGLYHVENITPEAVDFGRDLLLAGHTTYPVSDPELERISTSFPVAWPDPAAAPGKCFLGCPHMSIQQLEWWTEQLLAALARHGRRRLPVNTTICAAPQVLPAFRDRGEGYDRLRSIGVRLSSGCPMQIFDNDLSAGEAIVTNSYKLSAYTSARFFPDKTLVEIITGGEVPKE